MIQTGYRIGKKYLLLLSMFGFTVFSLNAQSLFMFKGVIIDSTTHKPVLGVKIYRMSERDTLQITGSVSGTFQVMLSKGAKLHFRKPGYAWHSIKINDNPAKERTVYLLPSKPAQLAVGNKEYRTEIIYDGKMIPQNEWNDVMSIRPSEIGSVTAYSKDGKNTLVIESKP